MVDKRLMFRRLLLLRDGWRSQNLGKPYILLTTYTPDSIVFQWKKYLTSMQIIQFVIDLFVVYFGSTRALWFNQGIICSTTSLQRTPIS